MNAVVAIHADPIGLVVAFGAGMLSFLSPCVLPLVPGYLSMVSGLSAAELASLGSPAPAPTVTDVGSVRRTELVGAAVGPVAPVPAPPRPGAGAPVGWIGPDGPAGDPSAPGAGRSRSPVALGGLGAARGRLLRGMLAFVAGFTVVFTALGASASSLGRLLLTHQRALETLSGVLIVAFGAVLVAVAAGLSLPTAVLRERRLPVRPSALGAWAPPVMGMAFAFAWTPCIGPVLGGVLTLAAGTGGSATGGVVLLVAYSLGIGVPFVLTGLAFERMTGLFARVRGSLPVVDLVGGVVLVLFGLLLLTGHVDLVSDTVAGWLRHLHLGRLATS